MKRNNHTKFPMLLSTLALVGCGPNLSTESIESGYECLKAASILDHRKARDNILEYMSNKPYASDQSDENKNRVKVIADKINSKYDGLYAGAEDIPYALEIYNMDVCITMHQQQKITLDDLLLVE